MINYLSFDVEDWFQVENFKAAITADSWSSRECRVEANTTRLLRLLADHNVAATFFVLGWIAERYPGLVRQIAAAGHEIASHGYGHTMVYRQTREAFRDDIRRAKDLLETITGKPVAGYRAPSFSITRDSLWAIDILHECGYRYDSSIFPTSFHNRYGFSGGSDGIMAFDNGLLEVPISTYRMGALRLPLGGGGYFRLLPYAYFKFFFERLNRQGKSFVFYLHPWEIDPGQPVVNVPWQLRFRHYNNLHRTENRLVRLLKDFTFQPIAAAVPAGAV
jgi:polysaccharide deacetylase family protein (PEP-CTERM system associated)